jgi:hypothetical protein
MKEVCRGQLIALVLVCVAVVGCGSAEDDGGGSDTGESQQPGSPQASPQQGSDGQQPGSEMTNDGATGSQGTMGNTSGDDGSAGSGGSSANNPPPEVMEQLDPDVDWTALTLVYDTMYSAYVEGIVFQVPVYVDGATIELDDWSAIPSSAVSFDPDPENDGVLITILEDVPEVTIAARSGSIGGTAPLYITSGTVEQWEAGEARYANGVELSIELDPGMTLMDFINNLDPNYVPPEPPKDLACNNCHTTGAKYFEIQHTPTQAARFSDEELETILTTGTKPDGVGYRVLPDMLFNLTADELYTQYHQWDASEDEIKGLIIYLRSLTPTGQGDILLPDGTYVAPGSAPPGL